jgi:hypothetical protein
METKQISLEKIYKAIQNIQQELHNINDKLDWENEFTEEENKEFEEGTRQAQKEIDEGKGITTAKEEFLAEMETWGKEDEHNKIS